jgi:hypothetical protein
MVTVRAAAMFREDDNKWYKVREYFLSGKYNHRVSSPWAVNIRSKVVGMYYASTSQVPQTTKLTTLPQI